MKFKQFLLLFGGLLLWNFSPILRDIFSQASSYRVYGFAQVLILRLHQSRYWVDVIVVKQGVQQGAANVFPNLRGKVWSWRPFRRERVRTVGWYFVNSTVKRRERILDVRFFLQKPVRLRVVSLLQEIDVLAPRVVSFNSVNQRIHVSLSVNDSSATTRPTITLPVLNVVLSIIERGRPKVKIDWIHWHEFRDQLCFRLLVDIFDCVSIDEAASLRLMGMEVNEHF